jgi:hypothetical protein
MGSKLSLIGKFMTSNCRQDEDTGSNNNKAAFVNPFFQTGQVIDKIIFDVKVHKLGILLKEFNEMKNLYLKEHNILFLTMKNFVSGYIQTINFRLMPDSSPSKPVHPGYQDIILIKFCFLYLIITYKI